MRTHWQIVKLRPSYLNVWLVTLKQINRIGVTTAQTQWHFNDFYDEVIPFCRNIVRRNPWMKRQS